MGTNSIFLMSAYFKKINEQIDEVEHAFEVHDLLVKGTAVAVALLVILVIALFVSLKKTEQRLIETIAPGVPAANAGTSAPTGEQDLMDDAELVAVITAAIQAYEEAAGNPLPANGLVVRSIKRVNKTKWQNA